MLGKLLRKFERFWLEDCCFFCFKKLNLFELVVAGGSSGRRMGFGVSGGDGRFLGFVVY